MNALSRQFVDSFSERLYDLAVEGSNGNGMSKLIYGYKLPHVN